MPLRFRRAAAIAAAVMIPTLAAAQISFPLSGYYAALGDSVAAGTGALPATNGYTYRLYEQGVFGQIQNTAFSNAAVRASRSWDLRDRQVPQVLCSETVPRPTVVTITSGANDVFRGDLDPVSIASRVVEAINILLHNEALPTPVLDPFTHLPCPALGNVTILVSNYYSIPHPDPAVFAQLDTLLRGFDQALRFFVGQLYVPAGSRVAVVDLYTPSLGRQGLVQVERRRGAGPTPLDFDPHPTNLGHAFIARQFAAAWNALQEQ